MAGVKRSLSARFFKLTLSAIAIVGLTQASDQAQIPASSNNHPALASHLYYPEVRLRKLHLVRPDLIPYPIFYDIYC